MTMERVPVRRTAKLPRVDLEKPAAGITGVRGGAKAGGGDPDPPAAKSPVPPAAKPPIPPATKSPDLPSRPGRPSTPVSVR